jgi:hypothetical protein
VPDLELLGERAVVGELSGTVSTYPAPPRPFGAARSAAAALPSAGLHAAERTDAGATAGRGNEHIALCPSRDSGSAGAEPFELAADSTL